MSESMLEDVARAVIEKKYPSLDEEGKQKMTNVLCEDLRTEVRNDFTDAEIQSLKERLETEESLARKDLDLKYKKIKMEYISPFILEAVFIAFCIGMIVNQVTNWIAGTYSIASLCWSIGFGVAAWLTTKVLIRTKVNEDN